MNQDIMPESLPVGSDKISDNEQRSKQVFATMFLLPLPLSMVIEIVGIAIYGSIGVLCPQESYSCLGGYVYLIGMLSGAVVVFGLISLIISFLISIIGLNLCFTSWSAIRNRFINILIISNVVSMLLIAAGVLIGIYLVKVTPRYTY
jgi:hypothetical protein